MATAEALASLLRERGPAVALTGAGMSTDSGIPDFRSAGGLWEGVDPYEVASIDAFRRDPLRVWRWYGERVGMLASAVPNAGHLALAELERDGHVRTVATQNIDALHTRAGSADVVELHGSIRRFDCLACGAVETLDAVLAQLAESPAPTCEECGAILKPGVVMFGELLPEDAIDAAFAAAESCDLLLAAGSSLEVHPVAGLLEVAKSSGAAVAILNRDPTPYDRIADVVDRRALGESLPALADAVLGAGS